MTYTEYVESRTTKELKEELKGLVEQIEVFDCFGTRELAMREHIEDELNLRGELDNVDELC